MALRSDPEEACIFPPSTQTQTCQRVGRECSGVHPPSQHRHLRETLPGAPLPGSSAGTPCGLSGVWHCGSHCEHQDCYNLGPKTMVLLFELLSHLCFALR